MNHITKSAIHTLVSTLARFTGALAAVLVVVYFTLKTSPYFMELVVSSYELTMGPLGSVDRGSLPYIYTTIFGVVFGVVATLLAVVLTLRASRRENRMQATIKIILDARMSEYFQSRLALVDKHFPPGKKASLATFRSLSESCKPDEQEAAEAVKQVLNFHEFIAAGAMKTPVQL